MAAVGIIRIADDFWNVRGSFKIAGLVDIGTHISLIRLANGNFLFLDSYTLSDSQLEEIEAITGGDKKIEAILNLHPFHTVHVQNMHERFPKAKLFGTARHLSKFPALPWQELRTEQPKLHAKFADDLQFSVPAGVDFVSANENVHFSSVLALHAASQTIHADDTLMYIRLPMPLPWLGFPDALSFHPTLSSALQQRAGAAQDFRHWAEQLIDTWGDAKHLCAAHSAHFAGSKKHPLRARLRKALDKVSGTLRRHQGKFG